MLSYARRDLLRNPRRTLASLFGVILGVGLFSGVLFFIDGSGASMTSRAIAPVALDVQRVLTAPLGDGLRLAQSASPVAGPGGRRRARVTLTVQNRGATPANEVVVNDQLPGNLAYVPHSARRGARPIPDVAGQSPFAHGPGRIGHNLGSVAAGTSVTLTYLVRDRAGTRPTASGLHGMVSSRERIVPAAANPPELVSAGRLRDLIAAIPGVAGADQLGFAELAPGSLHAGGASVDRPVKIFGFDAAYAARYRAIRLAAGRFDPAGAQLSPEAARALGAKPGSRIRLDLPGGARPLALPVSGIVDLSRSRPLFNSRQGLKLEDFLYIPDAIVVDPRVFRERVVPAFRSASAARGAALAVKSPPTLEVDIALERGPLNSDPAVALAQTTHIAAQVRRIAPGQDYLLDNISNTLEVARGDAAVAKRMFLFLGLPGLLLAGFLAAYAGSILAASQRREQANLRLRGAHRGHLLRILAYRTAALAGVGALAGTLLGFVSALAVLGRPALMEAATGKLVLSALVATTGGMLATGLAMYVPGRRALGRQISGERREMALAATPPWRRLRLDYIAVALTGIAAAVAVRRGAFETPAGSVSAGQSISLPSHLLLLPLGAWIAGTVLAVRAPESVARWLPVARPPRFGALVPGVLGRSLKRRTGPLIIGVLGVGLVAAFGVGLATFASTYDAAKQADAEFTVGANLRLTPSPIAGRSGPAIRPRDLEVAGVSRATPVVARLENAFMRSRFNSDVHDLAAIDPAGFGATAALSDSFFPGASAAAAMAALAADPAAILVRADVADGLKLEVGDTAEVLLARGSRNQRERTMTVAGLFERFPGFPDGLDIVANLAYYRAETGLRDPDFFLVRTREPGRAGLAEAIASLRASPAGAGRMSIDSTETSFNRDQSSLTALNVRGLVNLDSFFTLAISAAVMAIFVFGLMLQRRREYMTLRAQGMPAGRMKALVLGEASFVALGGLVAGVAVGSAVGLLLVGILTPLFILPPVVTAPVGPVLLIFGLVLGATLAAGSAALLILRRLSPAELLREQ